MLCRTRSSARCDARLSLYVPQQLDERTRTIAREVLILQEVCGCPSTVKLVDVVQTAGGGADGYQEGDTVLIFECVKMHPSPPMRALN